MKKILFAAALSALMLPCISWAQGAAGGQISSYCPAVNTEDTLQFIPVSEADSRFDQSHVSALLADAQKGDAGAQYRLGMNYYYGLGIKKDVDMSGAWVCKSASQGYGAALTFLALTFVYGETKEKYGSVDDNAQKETVRLLKMAADRGYAAAKFNLAMGYATGGDGLPQDPDKAKKLADESIGILRYYAVRDDMDAQLALAQAYASGLGVEQDNKEVCNWNQKAAQQGSPEGEWGVSSCFMTEAGGTKDAAQAIEWMQKSAEHGNPPAQRALARAYLKGDGVPKDLLKAYVWLAICYAQNQGDSANFASVSATLSPDKRREGTKEANEWLQGHIAHPRLMPSM